MAIIYSCFTCGSPDHMKADCPKRTRGGSTPPAPRLSPEAEERKETVAAPDCWSCGVVLVSFRWDHKPDCRFAASTPERIAEILDAAGLDHSGVVRTPYREAHRMAHKTEGQLRQLAAQQLAESRAVAKTFAEEEEQVRVS